MQQRAILAQERPIAGGRIILINSKFGIAVLIRKNIDARRKKSYNTTQYGINRRDCALLRVKAWADSQ
jgi:hypothetical protein